MSFWNRLFATKTLEMLDAEAKGENRLRRVLGPVGLTSLGVGAIIGAGIFVMTGRVAAEDAGPAIVVSYIVAGVACALAAFCYSEFASMAPVAGSALHLRLCHARRVFRLDHRLGPYPRIRHERRHRGGIVVQIP